MLENKPMVIDKDVADAIEQFFIDNEKLGTTQALNVYLIEKHMSTDLMVYEQGKYKALRKISTNDLMYCLVNSYTVKKETEEPLKLLKVWEAPITGSLGGRDDGYMETKYALLSIDTIAKNFKKNNSARYFRIEEMSSGEIEKIVNETNEKLNVQETVEKKKAIQAQMEKLQKELDSLK